VACSRFACFDESAQVERFIYLRFVPGKFNYKQQRIYGRSIGILLEWPSENASTFSLSRNECSARPGFTR